MPKLSKVSNLFNLVSMCVMMRNPLNRKESVAWRNYYLIRKRANVRTITSFPNPNIMRHVSVTLRTISIAYMSPTHA